MEPTRVSSRRQSLTLEARHTISLEVAKKRRLEVATNIFIPRNNMQHKAESVSRSSCQEKVGKGSKILPFTFVECMSKVPEPHKHKNARKPKGVITQKVNKASKTEKSAAIKNSKKAKSDKTDQNLSEQVSQPPVVQRDEPPKRQHGLPLLSAHVFPTDQQDTCPKKNISTMNKGGLVDQLISTPSSASPARVPDTMFQVNEIASSSQTPLNICCGEPETAPYLLDCTDTVILSSEDEERSEVGFGEHITNSQPEHEMYLVQEPEQVLSIEGVPVQSELAHVPIPQLSMQLCPIKNLYAPYATLLAQQGVTPEQICAENADSSSSYAPMILEGDSPTLQQMRSTIDSLTQSHNSLVPWHKPTNFLASPTQTVLAYQQTNETPPLNSSSRCIPVFSNIPQLPLASQPVSFQTTRHQPTSQELENQNRAMQTLAQTYLRKFSRELEGVLNIGGRQNLPAIQANELSYGRSPATLPMIFDGSNRNQATYSHMGPQMDRSNAGINTTQFQYPIIGTHQLNQNNTASNRSHLPYPTIRQHQINQDKADNKRNQFQYMPLRQHQIHQDTQRNQYLYPPMAFNQINHQGNASNNTNHLPYPPMGFYQANQANAGNNRSQNMRSHQANRGCAGIQRNNRTQDPYPSMGPYQTDRGNSDKLGFTNNSNKPQNQLNTPKQFGAHTDSAIGDESSSFCFNSNRMYPQSTPYSNFLYPSNQTIYYGSGYQNRNSMNMSSVNYRQSATGTPANLPPSYYQNYHNYTNLPEYDPRARR